MSLTRTLGLILLVFLGLMRCGDPGGGDELELIRGDFAGLGERRIARIENAENVIRDLAGRPGSEVELGRAHGFLAMHYHAYKIPETALHHYREAERLEPENFLWPYYQSRILMNLNRFDEGRDQMERVLELNPNHVPSLVYLGEYHRNRNRPGVAAGLFTRALESRADCALAMLGLARIANEQNNFAEAARHAEAALGFQPDATAAAYVAGLAYRGLGELEKAERYLAARESGDRPVTLDDDLMLKIDELGADGMMLYREGLAALEEGRLEDARVALMSAVEFDPNTPEFRLRLAWTLLRMDEKEAALAQYLEALPAIPGNADVHFNIGGLLRELDRADEAFGYYEKVLELDPTSRGAHRALADLNRVGGRFSPALERYQAMVALDEKDLEARLGRAMMLIRLARYAEAVSVLETDVAMFPNQPAFRQALARLLSAAPKGVAWDGTRALTLIEPFIADTGDPTLAETAAMACARAGRFDLAVKWQQKAIQLMPPGEEQTQFMNMALEGYRREQPLNVPWPENDPIFSVPTYGR
jgi:tetratricopeptide (TPR) repeat protein